MLEYWSFQTDDATIFARENHWKEALLTRSDHGCNAKLDIEEARFNFCDRDAACEAHALVSTTGCVCDGVGRA